jgi:hypothetical protein
MGVSKEQREREAHRQAAVDLKRGARERLVENAQQRASDRRSALSAPATAAASRNLRPC